MVTTEVEYWAGERTTYFMLDDDWVSKTEHFEDDPRVKMHLIGSVSDESAGKRDPRYTVKYIYRYYGTIIRVKEFENDGNLSKTREYQFDDNNNKLNEIAFNRNGEKSWESIYKLDSKGYAAEETTSFYGSSRSISLHRYSEYKFDKQGNWIERKETLFKDKDGKKIDGIVIQYRDIKYYP
ncbi:MAG TPA: hypothetical protein VGI80_08565 [Pyrinomonadaceae bacterium]